MQKSVADLKKLHQEQKGANFVSPSTRPKQEKVLTIHVQDCISICVGVLYCLMYFTSQVLKGQLFVDKCIEKQQFTFLDYISSGFELNFMVAVDFTGTQSL